MKLSIRLEAILSWLRPAESLLDVGCDHGYLPIEALRRGICQRAIASDVVPGPLERAKAHIEEAGLSDRIQLRLRSGLEGLRPGEAQALIIAGMGGRLIRDILEKAWLYQRDALLSFSQIILEPQSELDLVRSWLRDHGFIIRDEQLTLDRGKYYFIFDCTPEKSAGGGEMGDETAGQEGGKGGERRLIDPDAFSLPLLQRKDPLYRDYLEKILRTNGQIIEKLSQEYRSPSRDRRLEALSEENETIGEVIRRYYGS